MESCKNCRRLENKVAHLRRVSGVQLKKTTIKQSLVIANEEVEKWKEAYRKLNLDLMANLNNLEDKTKLCGEWHDTCDELVRELEEARELIDEIESAINKGASQNTGFNKTFILFRIEAWKNRA